MPTTTMPNFPLGDISRTFQAAAALLLERDGKLRLDDALGPDGVTLRQYLSSRRVVPDGGRRLADLVAHRSGGSFAQFLTRRVFTPIGAHRTRVQDDGTLTSNVDELYRWELGLESNGAFSRDSSHDAFAAEGGAGDGLGWHVDRYRGLRREAAYGTSAGMRNAMVRLPERGATIIVLTNHDDLDARALAERLADRTLFATQDPNAP